MQANSSATQHTIETPSGRIAYLEQGNGPVALFVHGVLLNGYLWRHQLSGLSDIRRCIAVDLLAHGNTEISDSQDVSVTSNAHMLREFLDALKIEHVDLVGNDSGSGIAQIFAALHPERVRSLTLTKRRHSRQLAPQVFKPFLEMAAAGGLTGTLNAMLADKNVYRSQQALGPAYEHPEQVSDVTIEQYLRPLVRNEQRTEDFRRFLAEFNNQHMLANRSEIENLEISHAHCVGNRRHLFRREVGVLAVGQHSWTRRRMELEGARIFFPEECREAFNTELRNHWLAMQSAQA